MPLTVKQCNASEMATLTNTLELFDTYKAQDEEKDSDEESFHLPLLDCEEDGDNTKANSDKKDSVNGTTGEENEDDILNKFDAISSTTPDIIDPKLEETLLNDKDDPKEDENFKEILATKAILGENSNNQTKDYENLAMKEHSDSDKIDKMHVDNVEENMEVDKKDSSYDDAMDLEGFVEIDSCGNEQSFEETENEVPQDPEISADVVMESDNNQLSVKDISMEIEHNSASVVNETDNSDTKEQTCSAESAEQDHKLEETANENENEENLPVSQTEEALAKFKNPFDEDTEMLELPKVVGKTSIAKENVTSVQVDVIKGEPESTDNVPVDKENGDKLATDNEKDCSEESMARIIENLNVDAEGNTSLVNVKNESDELEIGEICLKKESVDASLYKESSDSIDRNEQCSIKKELVSNEVCHVKKEDVVNNEEISEVMNNPSCKESGLIKTEEPETVATVEEDKHLTDEPSVDTVAAEVQQDTIHAEETNVKITSEDVVMTETSQKEDGDLGTSQFESADRTDSSEVPIEHPDAQEDNFPEPSKSPDLDSDDLLDVSMIRDQAEDDADLAAASVNDIQADVDETSNEKTEDNGEDNEEVVDKDEERDNSDKGEDNENELMESLLLDEEDPPCETDGLHEEADKEQQEIELHIDHVDKPEDMDSEPAAKTTVSEESATSSITTCESKTGQDNEKTSMEPTQEEVIQRSATGSNISQQEKEKDALTLNSLLDKVTEKELDTPVITKRPVSEIEDPESSATKRVRLSADKEKQHEDKYDLKALVSLSQFMKNKHLKQLTRADLEEFCVQKICEVIVHKSEIGDINQQLRIQEQMVEQLRKDQQQLNKQVRDLEIVNKKLMQELRMNKKPLIPLRITRSVGLQVRLANPSEGMKRNRPLSQQQQQQQQPQQQKTSSNATPVMSSPNRVQRVAPVQTNGIPPGTPRQIQPSPQKTVATTPILSSVLQSRRPPLTPVKSNTPARRSETAKPGGGGSGVIDLTDEDDKRNEGKKTGGGSGGSSAGDGEAAATKKVMQQVTPSKPITAMLSPGVRLATPTQVKAGPLTGVVASSSAQLMYVLQPGTQLPSGVITTTAGGAQKAVLLNVQSNGFLTSPILNGSAVSVIPKVTNSVQSKVVNSLQAKSVLRPLHKHPAPLPVPPPTRNNNPNLKPVPPKPHLSIRKTDTGIILQWRMPYDLDAYTMIASYQLYAYQETSSPPSTEMWRRVGDVKALALPMACTLTQFADKNKYYFAVRPVDVYKRIGVFSDPEEISL